jgi:hypothetical protein
VAGDGGRDRVTWRMTFRWVGRIRR